jgi:beta-lactamase regulating signal transducer with metallopeptidase domain
MGAAWLVYALVTGVFVALACFAVEGLCRQRRVATRWVWAAGLLAVALLSARAITAPTETSPAGVTVSLPPASGTAAAGDLAPDVIRSLMAAVAAGRALLDGALVGATRRLPRAVGEGALITWAVASALALLVTIGVHLRIARARRRWPVAELHGLDVRISPSIGPAVLGVLRPFIVVPRWLLARSDDEQRLVLAHEREHVSAHDHLLLSSACIVAALVPWHPAAWIMLARIRLAIELDCDARVLRRGVAPKVYGTLLIELASQCSGFTVGATALADEASHLQRRLLAMKPIRSRHLHLRTGVFAAIGLVAVLAACEAKLPTSAEVQNMDVSGAEMSMKNVNFKIDEADYFVDGKPVTSAEAHAIPSTKIASMNVLKVESGRTRIEIATGEGKESGFPMTVHMRHAATAADTAQMAKLHVEHAGEMKRAFTGVLLVDGVKVPASDMAKLNPNDIASVNVVKGAKALEISSDPAAANGVIIVTTKAAVGMKTRQE